MLQDEFIPEIGEVGYIVPWLVYRYEGFLWLPRDEPLCRIAGGTVCVGVQRQRYSYNIWYQPTNHHPVDPHESFRDAAPKEGSLVCHWLNKNPIENNKPNSRRPLYKAEPTWHGVYITSPTGHKFYVREDP